MNDEAVKELQAVLIARGRTPETVTWLAVGYAMAGKREEAERLLNELKQISKKQYVPETFFAYIYTALGQKEQAFGVLERAYREHDSTLIGLKTHPWLDPLRSDTRFADLLRRVGLSE
jgi:Flp pilus assembly protein TadD